MPIRLEKENWVRLANIPNPVRYCKTHVEMYSNCHRRWRWRMVYALYSIKELCEDMLKAYQKELLRCSAFTLTNQLFKWHTYYCLPCSYVATSHNKSCISFSHRNLVGYSFVFHSFCNFTSNFNIFEQMQIFTFNIIVFV